MAPGPRIGESCEQPGNPSPIAAAWEKLLYCSMTMRRATLASGPGWSVIRSPVHAGPHDRPFEEQHERYASPR